MCSSSVGYAMLDEETSPKTTRMGWGRKYRWNDASPDDGRIQRLC